MSSSQIDRNDRRGDRILRSHHKSLTSFDTQMWIELLPSLPKATLQHTSNLNFHPNNLAILLRSYSALSENFQRLTFQHPFSFLTLPIGFVARLRVALFLTLALFTNSNHTRTTLQHPIILLLHLPFLYFRHPGPCKKRATCHNPCKSNQPPSKPG